MASIINDNMSEISQDDAAMIKMSSTPSPTASNSASSTSASRRPPRKSTLTQQQKNQKRQRATQDQLLTLEMEFNKNPTPTATVRERIAEDINMTERSVQIWFQNRYVFMRLCGSCVETNETLDELKSSCLPKRASRLGKIVMLYPNLCDSIFLCSQWMLEKPWVVTSLAARA
jgi:hypothetical protein